MPNVPETAKQVEGGVIGEGLVTTSKIANAAVTTPKSKAGEEPAEPGEGLVTKGVVGVGKRQTFKYQGTGVAAQKPVLKHDLGTEFVLSTMLLEEGAHWQTAPVTVTTLSATEVRVETTTIESLVKGTFAIFVLAA